MCFRPATVEIDAICPNCGKRIPSSSATCGACGLEISKQIPMPGTFNILKVDVASIEKNGKLKSPIPPASHRGI